MDVDHLGQKLKALGDPLRLAMLRLLPTTDACEDVYNVSELAAELGVSQPTVSHHLCVLKQAGLVHKRKMCRDCYYWLDPQAIEAVREALGEQFLKQVAEGGSRRHSTTKSRS